MFTRFACLRICYATQPRHMTYATYVLVCFVLPIAMSLRDPVGFWDILPVFSRRLVYALCFTVEQQLIFGMVSVPIALFPMAGCTNNITIWCHTRALETVNTSGSAHVWIRTVACLSISVCLVSAQV